MIKNGTSKIITKTSIYTQRHKNYDVIGSKELNLCLSQLEKIMENIMQLEKIKITKGKYKLIKEKLDESNEELLKVIKSFGTESLKDLLYLYWGDEYIKNIENNDKFLLLEKYAYPISFKLMNWRIKEKKEKKMPIAKNRIVEDFMITDRSETLDCYDLSRTSSNFQTNIRCVNHTFSNRF